MKAYKSNSITLLGAVGLGTGVMISAGIFALVGQIAELSSKLFPYIFIAGSIVTAFSAYSYIKLSQHYPSAGGIGQYLVKAYGKGTTASVASLMMILSMVINQSLVARTFGSYTMQLFGGATNNWIIPLLGVILLIVSLVINLSGNFFIQTFTSLMSFVKIIGLLVFSFAGLYAAKFAFDLAESTSPAAPNPDFLHYIAATALAILAFKGFTTITNNGDEIKQPKINIGRAIMISIIISLFIYLVISFAVSSSLDISTIILAKDYALAEAAKPVFGQFGLWFTVILAMIATITAIIASVFAVSRLMAMLANMGMLPHKKISNNIRTQQQTLFYTVGLAMILTILFDLTRVASLGAILYLSMDMLIHYGLGHRLRSEVKSIKTIVWAALVLDMIVLGAFIYIKLTTDWLVVILSLIIIACLVVIQKIHFTNRNQEQKKS
ncbi:MAG TPA: APC family permease [Candidatus Izemoplasmatales bacterium]|nr:APC family permease [Candidatus Izemoplasmatales bacterium]